MYGTDNLAVLFKTVLFLLAGLIKSSIPCLLLEIFTCHPSERTQVSREQKWVRGNRCLVCWKAMIHFAYDLNYKLFASESDKIFWST